MSHVVAFDASSVVRLRSSHCSSHDASHDAFSLTLTTTALYRSSLGCLKLPLQGGFGGPTSISSRVTAFQSTCLVAHAALQQFVRFGQDPDQAGE